MDDHQKPRGVDVEPRTPSSVRRGPNVASLGFLFAVLYFVQGVGEPTEGLIAQPVRSLLKGWGDSSADIAAFSALMALPWSLKPLYGLITDFIPIFGSRRKFYLIIASLISLGSLCALFWLDLPPGSHRWLLVLLLLPTFAVSFTDVVTDGLMIDEGQPRGITGWLQSIQWAAMYAATILAGVLGGWLSEHGKETYGFLVAGGVSTITLIATIGLVREPVRTREPGDFRRALVALRDAARSRAVVAVGAFLFLWSFNPFSHTVLYLHMTGAMGYSEQFFGITTSVLSGACIVASVAYGFYCRRLSFSVLLHGTIAMGVVTTLAYWGLAGETSAIVVTIFVGLTYMTGSLAQLDLAARVCPPKTAATVFALLMALSNLAMSSATWIGGALYEWWGEIIGPDRAFDALVALGAVTTALCWLLYPWLMRLSADSELEPLPE